MGGVNMLIAGFGGQGVLFTGKIVAHAGLIDGREVSWLPSYGPEMRGGTANCSVCISDSPIGSPQVTQPEVLVAMNMPSYDKFLADVLPGGKIFIDSTLVQISDSRSDVEIYSIPTASLAKEHGLENLGNMIILGKLLKETGFSSIESVKKAMEENVPPSRAHLIELNMRAINLGMSL